MSYREMVNCLACGGTNLHLFCDLGRQPLSNDLKKSIEQEETLYPLSVNVCRDCYHSQLTVSVDKDLLYKHYLYVSGTTKTLTDEFHAVADVIKKENPGENKSVLDIACNDGTFLKAFRKYGWSLNGIDPAENITKEIQDQDLNIICDYFPSNKIKQKYDIITCFNVVAHIPNPYDFLLSCKEILSDDGTLYVQTSQKDMIVNGEFDTIYHEHHSFFTIGSMNTLVSRAGLQIVDIEYRPVHGKSYLFKIKKSKISDRILEESFLYDIKTYASFNERVERNKQILLNTISNSEKTVVGYGCAAKGVVRTNYYGIKHKYIVDENPLKIGKVVGGVNIPVVSPQDFANDPEPLLIVVYAWNFFDEIQEKIRKIRPHMNDEIISAKL